MWNRPAEPVIPWQITRVALLTKMLIESPSSLIAGPSDRPDLVALTCLRCAARPDRGDDLLCRIGQALGRNDIELAVGQNAPTFFHFGPFEPHH